MFLTMLQIYGAQYGLFETINYLFLKIDMRCSMFKVIDKSGRDIKNVIKILISYPKGPTYEI